MDYAINVDGLIDGLFAIARAIENLAGAVDRLGLNGVGDGKGAVEVLAMEVKGLTDVIEGGLYSLGER